jgi:hypothetical protein
MALLRGQLKHKNKKMAVMKRKTKPNYSNRNLFFHLRTILLMDIKNKGSSVDIYSAGIQMNFNGLNLQ